MKVLHVTPAYLPAYRYGGPIQSVHALNKYLVRLGAEVTVYTTAMDGPGELDVPLSTAAELKPVERDGVQVCYFKPSWPRSWFYSRDMRDALAAHAGEFDIVHITSVFLAASTLGARAAREAGKPYVISPRGSLMAAPLEKKSPLKKRLYIVLRERGNLEGAAGIHFTTEPEKAEYEKLGYRLRRAIVIPNGLDQDTLADGNPEVFRKKFGIPANKRIVLFLGRLNWKKGLDTLIPAFAPVAKENPEAVLVLAGGDDDNYRPAIEKMITAAGIQDKVVFTGPLAGADRTAAYRNAEIFVLPSYAENFGVAVVEAMYFGVPVIVSEEVALASMVRESGAGLVVKKDTQELAGTMSDLLKDPARLKAMGEHGISLAANKFSYAKVAQGMLEAYREVIASRGVDKGR